MTLFKYWIIFNNVDTTQFESQIEIVLKHGDETEV